MGSERRDPIDPLKDLPHVYPFVHLDSVVELGASRGVGIKNVSANSFFSYDRPEDVRFLPDTLLIEAMAQLCGFVMNFGITDQTAMVLAAISTMRFERRALAGESVFVTAVLEGSFGRVASFTVEASVGSDRIASGRLTLSRALAEPASLQSPSGKQDQ